MNTTDYYKDTSGNKIPIGVDFFEDDHIYLSNNKNGKQYTSCTTLLSKYKPKFDTEAQAHRYAARNGLDYQDVINMWEDSKNFACDFGTEIHKYMEDHIIFTNNQGSEPDPKDYRNFVGDTIYHPNLSKSFDWIIENLFNKVGVEDIIPEGLLWNDDYEIAGMSDIIINHPYNKFSILDFKTNKKYRYWNDFGENMLEPLEYLPVCEHSTYSLQMSVYAKFYSLITGRKFHCNMILYLDRGKSIWKPIYGTYLKHQVDDILDKHRNSLHL